MADLLNGAVGASRDVVDRGWMSYPHQVGLSGKTVTPALYMAIGISGALQHIAGMQTSEHIVAVNKEPDANIFKFCDFGIVGDLNDVIPLLIEKIKQYKSAGRRMRLHKYNPVTDEIVRELKQITGEKNVLYDEPDSMEMYSHDEVAEKHYAHMPEIVVKPSSAEEISKIMKLANKYMVPVTPRGAGSGLSGGAVPAFGGIVLSLEKMNRVLEIDRKNLMAVVEPGG
jgi:hypothetical protein